MNTTHFSVDNVNFAFIRKDEFKDFFVRKKDLKIREVSDRFIEIQGVKFLISNFLPNYTLKYNNNGKPHLDKGAYISISHSKSLIGIAWNFNFNIGLDIEEMTARITRIETRFIHDKEEANYIDSLSDKIKIWGIKEALIKLYDDKTLNLKNDLRVKKLELNKWIGFRTKTPTKKIEFNTFEFDNNIIVFNTTSEN